MLRKNEPIVPTERRLRAFNDLKSALLNAPALGIYRAQGEIIIDVDSSAVATGAVCQQRQDGKLVVLEFASRCFSKSERNLCATRRELTGLVFALKHFRSYLLGHHFVCRVDNMALSYIQKQKNPTGQLARYLDLIADYDFTLEHRPGKNHQNADAISRIRPCERGLNGEPCKQCHKRVTGKHVNAVQTRRQRRLRQTDRSASNDYDVRDSHCNDTKPIVPSDPSVYFQNGPSPMLCDTAIDSELESLDVCVIMRTKFLNSLHRPDNVNKIAAGRARQEVYLHAQHPQPLPI